MADLRRVRGRHPELPPFVLVHQGTVEEGEALLARLWSDARAVSDPERVIYAALGIGRSSWSQLLGPATWRAGLRALARGHFVGKPVGDPRVRPGLLLAHGARVLWEHEFRHSGDLPEEDALVTAVESALAADGGR